MSSENRKQCRGCKAAIEWQRTKTGGYHPVDPKIITIVSLEGVVTRGRVSHFATCPKADNFRKRSK